MTISQQPHALNLSGNVPDFILEDVAVSVTFKLYQGSTLMLDELYYPDVDGGVRVKVADLIHQLLYAKVPDYSQTIFHQQHAYGEFTVNIDDEDPIVFTVVKGFLQRADFDVEQFFRFNWLTTQPTSKAVKFHDPEWLTCYPIEAIDVRIRATFSDATTQTITYATLEAGKVQSINLNPGMIIGQFSAEPIKWEVYTEANGQSRQYVQTYRYGEVCDQYDDLFVFENRLGGIDTIRFTGTMRSVAGTSTANARFDEYTTDYFSEPIGTLQKNTGALATRSQLNHALDFFRAIRKHHLYLGYITGIYFSESPAPEYIQRELNSYTFSFGYSDFKVAYPEIAIPPQLLELPE
ncbi:MAG TPA: hypothetical protein VNQ80_12195 [Parapedobacter sp.]|uniref:hypothetical protein n=1 Tax=Parapedobacter sp. TaxID=1958893 RepID=UPI002C7AAC61|nr:hypothetical protein [Parapedobacter sp.]HWK58097.1 hypothetical protein [Parapedobacter sp.]